MNYFAKNLKYLRQKSRLSQEELAALVGLNRGNIASYEKQSAEPSMINLLQIGKFFNTELSDLIGKDLSLHNDLIHQVGEGGSFNGQKAKKLLVATLEENRDKIERFRKRSDEMARILDGFRQFHKFRMENAAQLSDDVKKLALDYEKLLDVLQEVLSTNHNMMELLDN
jgi:transcriptional regulator with XRE-family HTH domain